VSEQVAKTSQGLVRLCCYEVHGAEELCPVYDAKAGVECCYDSHDKSDECDNA
jgi:hypothetical protein